MLLVLSLFICVQSKMGIFSLDSRNFHDSSSNKLFLKARGSITSASGDSNSLLLIPILAGIECIHYPTLARISFFEKSVKFWFYTTS